MKRKSVFLSGTCLTMMSLAGLGFGFGQTADEAMAPPKVLIIQREMVKPGRAGNTHVKTESAFVQAMSNAKWPTHYLGMESLSGVSRALFFIGYGSFDEWEKDNHAMAKNAGLTAALDHASFMDGEQLDEYASSVWLYEPENSLRANEVDVAKMRYFELTQFKVRPGHEKDWADLVKLYKNAFEKAVPDEHWAVYESYYGKDNGGLYLVMIPMHSLAEIDTSLENSKKFEAALGSDGMKKVGELAAAAIESTQTNLFAFNPKMSYPSERWIKVDPEFWKPKPAGGMKKAATP
jgi:hypothetical protein